MTRRSLISLLVLLAPACAAETVAQPPAPPVNWLAIEPPPAGAAVKVTNKERASAEAYVKALGSPGFAQLTAVLDEAAHFACGQTDTHGRERVIAAHETLFGPFERRSFVLNRAWLTNDEKALEWTMTGVKADKPVTLHGLTLLWTKDDASISDIHVYFASPVELPGGEPRVFEKSGAPKETTNVGQMRALVHALEDNQELEFLALLSSDIQGFVPGPGKERARDYFRTMRKSLGQLDTVIENAWGVQDHVVIEYSLSGRQLAPLPGIPLVRDRILRLGLVDIGELHDGKITRIWRYDAPDALAMEPRIEK